MADNNEESSKAAHESLLDKIAEKIHGDSSSSDSDSEKPPVSSPSTDDSVKAKIYRLFGREKPVHKVLGGGKAADVVLWRDKKVSGAVLGGATAIWLLFEVMEYHLLTLLCHCLLVLLGILFLWSNGMKFINKSPPKIPEIIISEELAVNVARALRSDVNRILTTLREIAMGHDLKKFLGIIAGLWFLSIIGNCFSFLTLSYIVFIALHTIPVLYEKYDDKVDAFAEKVEAEFKKHYAVLHAKYLSKIPKGPSKDKKSQ